jgi:hypothetical protein
LFVKDNALADAIVLLTISPTLPAAALLFVVVPMTPLVELKVMLGAVIVEVTKVGPFAKAIPPEPVTFWPRAVATPVPYPVVPAIGKPEQFVSVPLVGVPRTGVTKVGLVVPAKLPVPLAPLNPLPT